MMVLFVLGHPLKSNMDRFIVFGYNLTISGVIIFKIQYG